MQQLGIDYVAPSVSKYSTDWQEGHAAPREPAREVSTMQAGLKFMWPVAGVIRGSPNAPAAKTVPASVWEIMDSTLLGYGSSAATPLGGREKRKDPPADAAVSSLLSLRTPSAAFTIPRNNSTRSQAKRKS